MIEKLHYITEGASREEQIQNAQQACEGGVKWLQFRMKSGSELEVKEAALAIQELCHHFEVTFIVNDHVNLVKEINADGVHIGKNDMSPEQARNIIGDQKILGCTANTINDIINVANYADYIGLGPFRFTSTKENLSPILGLEGYESIVAKCQERQIEIPIIAIGGILIEDVVELRRTGIHGVAVASLINHSDSKKEIIGELQNQLAHEFA